MHSCLNNCVPSDNTYLSEAYLKCHHFIGASVLQASIVVVLALIMILVWVYIIGYKKVL